MTTKKKFRVTGTITLYIPTRRPLEIEAADEKEALAAAAYMLCEMGEGEVLEDQLKAECYEAVYSN